MNTITRRQVMAALVATICVTCAVVALRILRTTQPQSSVQNTGPYIITNTIFDFIPSHTNNLITNFTAYLVDTRPPRTTEEISLYQLRKDRANSPPFIMDTTWPDEDPTKNVLFSLRTNGVPLVEIMDSGDVRYDTNNVSTATRIFWRELSFYIKSSLDQ